MKEYKYNKIYSTKYQGIGTIKKFIFLIALYNKDIF